MTSHLRCWCLFWYVWKEETLAILWYQLHVSGGFHFQGHSGGSNAPLVNCVPKKVLVGQGLKVKVAIIRWYRLTTKGVQRIQNQSSVLGVAF